MGFADNVFDQKRGRRESGSGAHGQSGTLPGVGQIAGKKRSITTSADAGPATPLRKIELPTPEPDFSGASRRDLHVSREGSEYPAFSTMSGQLTNLLPSMKTITGGSGFLVSPTEDRGLRVSSPSGVASLANQALNTLPPMLNHNQPFHPQHNHSLNSTLPLTSTPTNGNAHASPICTSPREAKAAIAANIPNDPIAKLELQIAALKRYEDEFKALDLEDSRKMLSQQLAELEGQLKVKKREKGMALMERLKKEGFGGLAEVVGKEVGVGLGIVDGERTAERNEHV